MAEVCVSVTHRITHETFKGIMELSGLLEKKKKKGKGKKGGKKVSVCWHEESEHLLLSKHAFFSLLFCTEEEMTPETHSHVIFTLFLSHLYTSRTYVIIHSRNVHTVRFYLHKVQEVTIATKWQPVLATLTSGLNWRRTASTSRRMTWRWLWTF